MRQTGTQLIVAGHMAAQQLKIQLPDLQSRLQSGLLFQLSELSDGDKLLALQLRARQRGLDLPDAVGEFILLRADRNLSALMQILGDAATVRLSSSSPSKYRTILSFFPPP